MGSACSKSNYSRRDSRKELVNGQNEIVDLDNTIGNNYYSNDGNNSEINVESEVVTRSHTANKEQYWSTDSQKSDISQFQAHTLKRDTLVSKEIKLPYGYDEYTWIYEKALFYLEECRLVFDSISDHCNPQTCPEMTAGPHYTYLWTDDIHREPIAMPACSYISNVFIWIENVFNSEEFSCISDGIYPDNYMPIMRIVFKKLFRVYAHVYHHHLDEFIKQKAEIHLNTSFKYFGMFVREFDLISRKEEAPLHRLLENLLHEETIQEDD